MKKKKINLPTSGTNLGGALESKGTSGKFQKFKKNNNQKNIIIGSMVILLLLVGGITLYKTFALYEEKKEFNVLKGRVPDFRILFSDYIIEQSTKDASIEKFEHVETEQTKALTDYRYTGVNPNNYIYFGCENNSCTEENLYRIIGVIPTQSEIGKDKLYEYRVKLVKNKIYEEQESNQLVLGSTTYPTSTGYGYRYSTIKSNNKWENSIVNETILNGVYWESLKQYQKYIAISVWYLGAASTYTDEIPFVPNKFYNLERGTKQGYSKGNLQYINNIGLMYPSDYGYSLGSTYRNETVVVNDCKTLSWLYRNEIEHLITPESDYYTVMLETRHFVMCNDSKYCNNEPVFAMTVTGPVSLRPTFYLKSNVVYSSGNGTKDEPYRISISE